LDARAPNPIEPDGDRGPLSRVPEARAEAEAGTDDFVGTFGDKNRKAVAKLPSERR
jgi:hypothetical protein